MLYLGADHRGFTLKKIIKNFLIRNGIDFTDLGNEFLDTNDDYVLFAQKVADAVIKDRDNRGIVICGSGVGVDITANKVDGIRCALVYDRHRTIQSRQHEDINMVALPADVLSEEEACEIVKAFLNTSFSGEERHIRRLDELKKVEEEHH